MHNPNKFLILGGPSSIGKSSISKILSEVYGIPFIHKREFNPESIPKKYILETHYSSNKADEKYSREITPDYSDFFSKPFLNINPEIFKNFDKKLIHLICLYAKPETIIKRSKERYNKTGRNPRSLDKNVINFETESEIKMCNELDSIINKSYKTNLIFLNTDKKSQENLAKEIYLKIFQ